MQGWQVNAKRVHRLYRLEGLQVCVKRRRKLASGIGVLPPGGEPRERALDDGLRVRIVSTDDNQATSGFPTRGRTPWQRTSLRLGNGLPEHV